MLNEYIWFFWTPSLCTIGLLMINASRIQLEELGNSDGRLLILRVAILLIVIGVGLLLQDLARVSWKQHRERQRENQPCVSEETQPTVDKFKMHRLYLEAQVKAEVLAKEVMGGDLELWAKDKLFVEGTMMNGKYKILSNGKVAFYPFGDYPSRQQYQFCIIPLDDSVPLLDRVVAMYLMCKNDERKLWNTANIS